MMTTDVRTRIDPELKQEATAVLEASGLDVSTAIRLFLRSVVETGGMPIAISKPNQTTVAAIKAAKAGKVKPISLKDL